ncbi:hypothetical protein ACFX19_012923 [Malus domestica]
MKDALNSALDEEMSADPKVFLIGEEVGEYQGAYKITKGLLDKYGPDRVLDTPIIEAGFTGIGVGAAYYACPGLKVLTYSSEDARGLLKAAIKDPDPVVFLENELLYGESFPVSAEVLDPAAEILAKEGINAEHGVDAEICASVVEDSFGYLDAPVERISGADVPMPYAANLERLAVPQVEDIVRAAKRACYKSSSLAASA